jgi:hypothetical protein
MEDHDRAGDPAGLLGDVDAARGLERGSRVGGRRGAP